MLASRVLIFVGPYIRGASITVYDRKEYSFSSFLEMSLFTQSVPLTLLNGAIYFSEQYFYKGVLKCYFHLPWLIFLILRDCTKANSRSRTTRE